MKRMFFAASNGRYGFVNYFDKIFSPDELDTIYIIKGGPGTGKSTFIKKLGEYAESLGCRADYYLCSSDPDSFDGVIFDHCGKKIAVIDGTSPHVTDAKYPAACEKILNFTESLSEEILRQRKTEIADESARMKECYRRAYAFFDIAGRAHDLRLGACERAYKRDKAEAFIQRFFRGFRSGAGNSASAEQCAVCHKGRVRLQTLANEASTIYFLSEHYGAEQFFLAHIYEYAKAHRIPAVVSHSAVFANCVDSVFFYDAAVLVAVLAEGDERECLGASKKINTARFADAEMIKAEREFIRGAFKLEEAAVQRGIVQMSLAKKHHDALERIYGSAADFDGINDMFLRVRREIFGQRHGDSDL